jgi:hypothetical protein
MWYLLLSHYNSGCTNAPQLYVIRTLRVLLYLFRGSLCKFCSLNSSFCIWRAVLSLKNWQYWGVAWSVRLIIVFIQARNWTLPAVTAARARCHAVSAVDSRNWVSTLGCGRVSRPAAWSSQTHIRCAQGGSFSRCKAAGTWSWWFFHLVPRLRMSGVRLHCFFWHFDLSDVCLY